MTLARLKRRGAARQQQPSEEHTSLVQRLAANKPAENTGESRLQNSADANTKQQPKRPAAKKTMTSAQRAAREVALVACLSPLRPTEQGRGQRATTCSHAGQASSSLVSKESVISQRIKTPSQQQQQQQQQRRCSASAHAARRPSGAVALRLTLGTLSAALLVLLLVAAASAQGGEARVTFEKMTNRDYSGVNYYTIQNVSLFECLGWCKEEVSCTSAVFSFVVNPFAALQETTCMLQNETQARQGAYLRTTSNGEQVTIVAQPQKATNLYFFNKIELGTESVCSRLWAFERFPNRRLRQRDRSPFHAASKESCQAACMNEQRFVCRSIEYNYVSQQCVLSAHDRRSPLVQQLASQSPVAGHGIDLIEAPGTDYFENACLLGEDICNESRVYDYVKVGLPLARVAHFVELNYYPDKEMLVKSQGGCVRACTIEHEFICRSILYRPTFKQGQPNCALYHLDQRTFPEGADAFMSHVMQPLLDSGDTSAVYLEAICNDTITSGGGGGGGGSSSSAPVTITMPPTSIMISMPTTPNSMSVYPHGGGSHGGSNHTTSSSSSGSSSSTSATLSDMERYVSSQQQMGSTSTLSPIMGPPTTIRLPATFLPPITSTTHGGQIPTNIQISDLPGASSSGRLPSHITISPPNGMNGGGGGGSSTMSLRPGPGGSIGMPSHITISPAPTPGSTLLPSRESLESGMPQNIQISTSGGVSSSSSSNHDQNCDAHGFCYDVALKCTDTKMVVNVKTQRPFFGRIYALGRSETCNSHIKNQNQFQLDMYLTGQDCNTQSASGTYTNTIVLQHHNVVLTKADKVYHVRCTYETASRNVSFGMMPVKDMFEVDVNDRNQETISITASSDAPLPKISILTLEGKEASTVRIGDRLTFRIEIPDNTPYGIFARSCIAMAKDARSTFEIIDEHGCPVDHTIFPNFLPLNNGNALESNYEAFRFTESYGVIFQCNVKYCIGKCEPVNCGIGREQVESWGRKKRSIGGAAHNSNKKDGKQQQIGKQLGDDMTLSREIVVLDLKERLDGPAAAGADSPSQQQQQQQHSTDDLISSSDGYAQKSPLKSAARQKSFAQANQDGQSDGQSAASLLGSDGGDFPLAGPNMHCLSSQSLLLLICSIGIFFVLYVCLVAYFFARRDTRISVIKQQYH